ncbi:MAG TPA: CinA family nicotinamide mononucleotide deamidase-related protein, partial [Verrucomicrobiae bacterium]|nr:CinA family nicotinamide mononucleotide deamidase-related protein [Verrucomicrobiae bacterium]
MACGFLGVKLRGMVVEIVNTGSELMLGRVLNTHQQWLCRQLSDLGWVVARQVGVADTGPAIQAVVRESLGRADLVVTTGGLGPTSDDITRDLIADLLGRGLREDPAVLARITGYFTARKRRMPERIKLQALVPEGAIVLPNDYGTAPGLAMEVRPNPFRPGGAPSWLVMLPGPPRELQPMFREKVIPFLEQTLPKPPPFVCRTIRATGMGESLVEERVSKPLDALVKRGLELGYCARLGEVDVRLAAHGLEAGPIVSEAEKIVTSRLGGFVFGADEEKLETWLIRVLTERKKTVALAESCTGGLIASRLTDVPGASAVLLAGLVTYSNEAKLKFLGVQERSIAQHGAVSEQVAR